MFSIHFRRIATEALDWRGICVYVPTFSLLFYLVSVGGVELYTVTHEAPLSMGFSRQEYWSGLPFRLSGDLPNPSIKPRSLACRWRLPSEPPGKPDNWSGQPMPSPGDHTDPGIKPGSPALQAYFIFNN